ncbi:MAG: DUF4249 domain-containing protein [Bacteroidales bacterium]|nr:DUF4249 domain-containing protein [Bacteroidales bacterium]
MRRCNIIIIALIALLTSCSEVIDLKIRETDETFFVVDRLLTNMAEDPQDLVLSRSLSYFSDDEVPAVSGAEVSVTDGTTTTVFSELEDVKGTYRAPAGFACRKGRTYNLSIKATLDGMERTYSATSTMPGAACSVDSIVCYYTPVVEDVADSCWTVLIWAKDNLDDGYYMTIPAVNGHTYPFQNHLVLSDMYFAGKRISGFPTSILLQTSDNYKKYGECAKYLEKGDVIRLDVYNLTKDYYNFVNSVSTNVSGQSIPLFSPQPCNCPTNIEGENALGYFSTAFVVRSEYTIDDPFKEKHDE